ncbi:hypothetical protein [Rhizobium leguminosarum]|uniref:hypothetical protein n=1 Tax=Rhizobium leguminosarum TaxID=384 RepID=UPI001C95D84A|nr:hypothetical protein [Rhizobium leguminosarum]MBY5623329.1 hypothetical protein [Rhizobium leguminosarum]
MVSAPPLRRLVTRWTYLGSSTVPLFPDLFTEFRSNARDCFGGADIHGAVQIVPIPKPAAAGVNHPWGRINRADTLEEIFDMLFPAITSRQIGSHSAVASCQLGSLIDDERSSATPLSTGFIHMCAAAHHQFAGPAPNNYDGVTGHRVHRSRKDC